MSCTKRYVPCFVYLLFFWQGQLLLGTTFDLNCSVLGLICFTNLAAQSSHRKIALTTVATSRLAAIPLQKSQSLSLRWSQNTIAAYEIRSLSHVFACLEICWNPLFNSVACPKLKQFAQSLISYQPCICQCIAHYFWRLFALSCCNTAFSSMLIFVAQKEVGPEPNFDLWPRNNYQKFNNFICLWVTWEWLQTLCLLCFLSSRHEKQHEPL